MINRREDGGRRGLGMGAATGPQGCETRPKALSGPSQQQAVKSRLALPGRGGGGVSN